MNAVLTKSLGRASSLILTIFVAVATSWTALASNVESQFRAAGASVPLKLKQLGYSQFGSLNLNNFISEIESSSVEINVVNGWSIAEANGNGRSTARWRREGGRRIIDVNAKSWTRAKQSTALHEFLGVLGFNDNNYTLSGHLTLLANPKSKSLSDSERGEIERRIEILSRTQMADGTNSSGGGESMTAHARAYMIEKKLKALSEKPEDGLAREKQFQELTETASNTFEVRSTHMSRAQKMAVDREMKRLKPAQCLVGPDTCRLRPMTSRQALKRCTCPGVAGSGTVMLETN